MCHPGPAATIAVWPRNSRPAPPATSAVGSGSEFSFPGQAPIVAARKTPRRQPRSNRLFRHRICCNHLNHNNKKKYLVRIKQGINNLEPVAFFTTQEAQTLKSLSEDHTLVIKQADKGSGIVIEDTKKYIEDGLDHLANQTIYRKIDRDPTESLVKEINNFVKYMYNRGIVDSITKDYLTFQPGSMPRTQQLYFLKKIHKNPISVRPIVSGCGGPTKRISQLVDLHLKPFVPKIKSYIRDSGHLIVFWLP